MTVPYITDWNLQGQTKWTRPKTTLDVYIQFQPKERPQWINQCMHCKEYVAFVVTIYVIWLTKINTCGRRQMVPIQTLGVLRWIPSDSNCGLRRFQISQCNITRAGFQARLNYHTCKYEILNIKLCYVYNGNSYAGKMEYFNEKGFYGPV